MAYERVLSNHPVASDLTVSKNKALTIPGWMYAECFEEHDLFASVWYDAETSVLIVTPKTFARGTLPVNATAGKTRWTVNLKALFKKYGVKKIDDYVTIPGGPATFQGKRVIRADLSQLIPPVDPATDTKGAPV